jgi:hypothetical protein
VPSLICSTCTYEYAVPLVGPIGPCCPRCGDPCAAATESEMPAPAMDDFMNAAVVGAALGVLVSFLLLMSCY